MSEGHRVHERDMPMYLYFFRSPHRELKLLGLFGIRKYFNATPSSRIPVYTILTDQDLEDVIMFGEETREGAEKYYYLLSLYSIMAKMWMRTRGFTEKKPILDYLIDLLKGDCHIIKYCALMVVNALVSHNSDLKEYWMDEGLANEIYWLNDLYKESLLIKNILILTHFNISRHIVRKTAIRYTSCSSLMYDIIMDKEVPSSYLQRTFLSFANYLDAMPFANYTIEREGFMERVHYLMFHPKIVLSTEVLNFLSKYAYMTGAVAVD